MCLIPTYTDIAGHSYCTSGVLEFRMFLGDVCSLLGEGCQTRLLEPFEILELVDQTNNATHVSGSGRVLV